MAISLKPEELFDVAGFGVTNSFITFLIITAFIFLFVFFYTKKITVKPGSVFQLIIESLVTGFHNLAVGIMGEKASRDYFPAIFTFFILIILSNWFGLLPIAGTVGFSHKAKEEGIPLLVYEDTHGGKEENGFSVSNKLEIEKPLFRSPSADLNFTIAMAIISFMIVEIAGLRSLGIGYLGKFIDLRVKPGKGWKIIFTPFLFVVNVFWRLLETVLELSRVVSFSFRLFGNIFAGEVLLIVLSGLIIGTGVWWRAGLGTLGLLPFLAFELFVGFIQAIVFIFLTMVFTKVASEHH